MMGHFVIVVACSSILSISYNCEKELKEFPAERLSCSLSIRVLGDWDC